jgi:hypothetical protein
VLKRVLAVVLAGLTIYLVLPSLMHVLRSWPRLSTLNPIWFAVAAAAEIAHFFCTFALQRLALRTKNWFAVVTSELTGNAITNVMPGADAAGAAVQYRMLAVAGIDADTAVSGLVVFSLMQVGGLLALPIFALPAILVGAPVSRGLLNTVYVGIGAFVLFAVFSMVILRTDRLLAMLGRAAQALWNRVARRRPPLTHFDDRLLHDRDAIMSELGTSWREAVLLCAGRLGFDFACLLAVLRATGCHPRPSLVLLAYAVANIVGLLPFTPGGLGVVEASLSGMLVLAGVSVGDAFLATLAYRIACYWLPLLAGPPAYLMFRHRYGSPEARSSAPPK